MEEVSLRVGAGVSTLSDPFEAGIDAARAAAAPLDGAKVDLALVFLSGGHLVAPEATLEGVSDMLDPGALSGCGAGGVLGDGRELEDGTGVAVWAASFDRPGCAEVVHLSSEDGSELTGLPPLADTSAAIVLADPYSFATDELLSELAVDAPGLPVLGGLASARAVDGSSVLFAGGEVHGEGAVVVTLDDVEVLPCVSQGAAPIGRELTITAAEGNIIHELAGRPALQTLQQVIAELRPRERGLVAGGVLIGIVIDGGKPEYEQGDFLVRGVLGADPESGSLAVGEVVRPGQVVRLHARDAQSADEDLNRALELRLEAMAGRSPAGSLLFSCNGRGRGMFGTADHDAGAVKRILGGAPAAGFFAAGEIGPVGGRSFLHGFTATLAVFADGA